MSITIKITDSDFKAIYTTIKNINHSGICKYSKSIMFHHGISLRLEASATKTTKLESNEVELMVEADKLGISVEDYKTQLRQKAKDDRIHELMRRYNLSTEDATTRYNEEYNAKMERLKKQFREYKESKGESVIVIDDNEFEEYCISIGEGTKGLYKTSYPVSDMTIPYIQYSFDASKTGTPESGNFGLDIQKIDYLPSYDELKRMFKVYTETEDFERSVSYITDIMKEELKIKVE